jgi:hypothetical protein
MALFGRADKDLPLLTRAYQVDTKNEGEMLFFAYLDETSKPDEDVDGTTIPEDSTQRKMLIEDLRSVLDLAKEVMDCLCDHNGLTPGMGGRIERQVNKTKREYDVPSSRSDSVVPLDNITLRYITEHDRRTHGWNTVHTRVIIELDRLVVDVKGQVVSLSRCEECNSVYIKRKAFQKNCSHRCTANLGEKHEDIRGLSKRRVL